MRFYNLTSRLSPPNDVYFVDFKTVIYDKTLVCITSYLILMFTKYFIKEHLTVCLMNGHYTARSNIMTH